METKQKIKSHVNAEDIVFWKWINDSTLGMVTETAVYHWTISDATSPPQKIFDRHPTLVGAQIINYRTTSDEKWLVLVGISGNTTNPAAFKVKGNIQLYSRERGVSQPIEGHAAAFAELKIDGCTKPTKLFTFCARTAQGAKVCGSLEVLLCMKRTPCSCVSCTSSRLITRRRTHHSPRRMSMSTSLLRRRTTSPSQCRFPKNTASSIS